MSLVVKDTGGEIELPPAGTWPSFCVNWFDVGPQSGFEGKVQNHVIGMFELVVLDDRGQEVRMTQGDRLGKRFLIFKEYNASLNEASNLSIDLTSWRGREFTRAEREGFDIEVTKGKACQLNVVAYTKKTGKPGVKFVAITPVPRGVSWPWAVETPGTYVPGWIEAKVRGGVMASVEQGTGVPDQEIPF